MDAFLTCEHITISTPELTGLHAVVTGASSGIGRACALRFAQAGASLVIQAHQNRDALHSLRDEAVALGGTCDTVLADLSSLENCSRLVREAWRRKPIDIWLHCAGADVLTGEAAQFSFFEKLDLLWKVDVRGTMACCRAVGHRMHERGTGVVLTIGWDQATFGMEGDSGEMFAAIKGSVMSFTQSLARSLAPQVRVNCLAPGWIRTKWGETASGTWDERAQREVARRPVGRTRRCRRGSPLPRFARRKFHHRANARHQRRLRGAARGEVNRRWTPMNADEKLTGSTRLTGSIS